MVLDGSEGRPKDCVRIKDFLLSRKAAVAAVDIDDDTTHSERTGSDDTNDVDADAGPGASAERPLAPLLGNCLVNPVFAKGKDVFGFEIGETLVLHYSPEEADSGFKKFVGAKTFTCSVARYKVKEAAKEKGGRGVENNGDIEMTVYFGRLLAITK